MPTGPTVRETDKVNNQQARIALARSFRRYIKEAVRNKQRYVTVDVNDLFHCAMWAEHDVVVEDVPDFPERALITFSTTILCPSTPNGDSPTAMVRFVLRTPGFWFRFRFRR